MKRSNNKISFFPNSFHQWVRAIIGIIAIIIIVMKMINKINFEKMATWVTLVGFIGYVIDGLFENINERKDKN